MTQRTDAITRLVDEILIFKQLDREAMRMMPVAMGDLIREVVQGAEATIAQVGLAMRVEMAESLPLVHGDRDQLVQVLHNLLGNAIKFSPDGGTITVRVRPIDTAVQVAVTDEGIGIPANQIEKIFERFYQVDGSSRRRFGGTGLGLAIVKRIVEAHKGKVWVESKEGKGSTFFFTLPTLSSNDVERDFVQSERA
jgi:two-component system sensor histidine kinase VicK